MGCDIHILIEYRAKRGAWPDKWTSFGYKPINPGRSYELFNKLSGVRGDNDDPIATSGWPRDVSWAANCANNIYITEDSEKVREGVVSMETAQHYVKSNFSKFISNAEGKIVAVTNPDWHSHGYCTVKQMAKALRGNTSPVYRAMVAAARSLYKDNMDVRFIFFYDN